MLTVVTGWSPAGYIEYGRRFLEGFDRFWPKSTQLLVYGEEPCDLPRNGLFVPLQNIPGCMEFLTRNDNPVCRGQIPAHGYQNRWKPKHYARKYNFRFDAWKFCRQGFIPFHALTLHCAQAILTQGQPRVDPRSTQEDDDDFLCWLDGDVVTHRAIPAGFVEGLMPRDKWVAYLGRGEKHSEIGFQLYRTPGSWTFAMLSAFSHAYSSDEVFTMKEWHSAWVWDICRIKTQIPAVDLTPGGHGHVWHQSPLRVYTDHLKGDRKGKGKSDERREY